MAALQLIAVLISQLRFFLLLILLLFAGLLLGCHTVQESQKPIVLKLMTYNIRIGKGGGEWNNDPTKVDLEPVAKVIASQRPDIIGLQEVDRFRKRTAWMDQPSVLGKCLNLKWTFQPAYTLSTEAGQAENYGVALMSRFTLEASERFPLFKLDYSKIHPEYPDYYSEQRALLHSKIMAHGRAIHVFVTHLGLTSDQREKQIAEIAEITSRYSGPKILFGDFNAEPAETALEKLKSEFQDVLTVTGTKLEERKSFPAGTNPAEAIDYIFVSPEFRVLKAQVIRDKIRASDHNPVIAEVDLLPENKNPRR